jgi:peptidyl-prolyl cis-trans isomerase SurA
MTMTTTSHRLSSLILGCAGALLLMSCGSPLRAQTVAVMVNGEPITNYDIEQRSKLNTLSTHKPAVRQEVINELIDEKSGRPKKTASIRPLPISTKCSRR